MSQVINAVQNSNANAGGNYLTLGSQSVNVRGIGLLHSLDDMRNIVIAERNGVPVLLRDVAEVRDYRLDSARILCFEIPARSAPRGMFVPGPCTP